LGGWQLAVEFQFQFQFQWQFLLYVQSVRGEDFAYVNVPIAGSGLISFGASFALRDGMKELSPKRKRTLALQERAIMFSVNVNACCPEYFSNIPSKTVWGQLVRAADSTSNNLVEADDAVSDADFLNKMGIALREAKEARTELMKLRLGSLDNHSKAARLELESEATQLTAIFATIIGNMRLRLDNEKAKRKN
jgi:four helix bundle protein